MAQAIDLGEELRSLPVEPLTRPSRPHFSEYLRWIHLQWVLPFVLVPPLAWE